MVFVKREEDEDEGYNVYVTLRLPPKVKRAGEVGVEVEVEGRRLPKEPDLPWVYHVDHSLRGAENAEYVLDKPVLFSEIDGHVDGLYAMLTKAKATLDDSNRTSVHVHLNVQPFFLNRLASLMGLYFTFEEIFAEWCGEHRVGNLFCLRAKDAPAIVSQIRRFIRTGMQAPLRDHHHYAGLNGNAIHKFGSLEFRTLRGVSDPSVIKTWVSILRRLYDLSEVYTDPREICSEFSYAGPQHFFDHILGDRAAVIRQGIEFDEERIGTSLYEGIRLAQDICFARDWSRYKPLEYKEDPFHRPAKKRGAPTGFDIDAAMNEVMEDFEGEDDEGQAPPPANWIVPAVTIEGQAFATMTTTAGQTLFVNQGGPFGDPFNT